MATRAQRQLDALKNELEPMIYSYFGLIEPEITPVETANDIFAPGSTPTIWNTRNTVTLEPLEKLKKLKKVLTMHLAVV
jgi:hypothetical protein